MQGELDSKRLKKIGHQLKPIVTIGGKGLSETVLAELNRALNDHELIKIRIPGDNREDTIAALLEQVEMQIIQQTGNILLVYRAAARPDPKLSNLLRHSAN